MTVVVPKPAATVIVFRESDGAVLLIRRGSATSLLAGAYAFPGGVVETADLPAGRELASSNSVWSSERPPAGLEWSSGDLDRLYLAYEHAARRELEEETGVKQTSALRPWARWITPESETRRYDTLFFIAKTPGDTEVTVDGGEVAAHLWLTPAAALVRFAEGNFPLPPPTYITLAELAALADLDALFSVERFPRREVAPVVVNEAAGTFLLMPGDAGHALPRVASWPSHISSRIAFAGPGLPWRFVS